MEVCTVIEIVLSTVSYLSNSLEVINWIAMLELPNCSGAIGRANVLIPCCYPLTLGFGAH